MKITKSSGNVFEDVGFDSTEGAVLKLRSSLMLAIKEEIERRGITQAEAAKIFGVTQPRISDLMRGKIGVFNVESLIEMLGKVGVDVSLSVGAAQRTTSPARAYVPTPGVNFKSKD